jgi:hypothetical protein
VDYAFRGEYNHVLSPSLTIRGFADYVSGKNYYSEISPNLDDRLDRVMTSQVTVKKTIGTGTSITTLVKHVDKLDIESRSDILPQVNVSLPAIFPFGNGTAGDQHWYNDFKFRYSPVMKNISDRVTVDSGFVADTSIVPVDSTDNGDGSWTIIAADTTIVVDTLTYRSRKEYAKIQHNPTLTLPTVKFGDYLNLVPSFAYSETWFKIFETDQSRDANVPADNYRTYSWNAGLRANTTIYGTVYPNLFGLLGLRQVLEPSAAYSYKPDIDRHADVRSYAGGGAGSAKSSSIILGLNQEYMAKVASGEDEKTLNLFRLRSTLSHDFENEERPYSDLVTTYSTGAIPRISISGRVTHSLYEPGTNNLSFWSPYRTAFSFKSKLKLAGGFGLFDESTDDIPRGADSAAGLTTDTPSGARGRWRATVDYQYSEKGRGSDFSASSVFKLALALNFNLTAATSVAITQSFDLRRGVNLNSRVNIIRKLHCWTGSLYWVPTGSNRGFGFKLFVTEIPAIKIDNGHDSYLGGVQGLY